MKTSLLILAIFFLVPSTFSAASEQQIKLTIRDTVTGLSNQAFIYFDQGLSTTYSQPQDEQMVFDTVLQVPDIYSFTSDGVPCYSNGYGDFTQTTKMRLGIRVAGGSTYTFYPVQLNNFDATSLVLLEDHQFGTITDLRVSPYSVTIDSAGRIDNRFYLLISYPPQISFTQAGCDNNNGVISVTEDTGYTWTACHLYNSQSNQVGLYKNIGGNFNFPSLPEDSYNIEFDYGLYATTQNVFLPGNQITVNITASSTQAAIGENIDFYSTAVNATNYEWNMGDSTIITDVANPTYAYLSSGTYDVILKCTNPYGCMASASLPVQVSEITTSVENNIANNIYVFSNQMDVRIKTMNTLPDDYVFEMYNLSGQLLSSGPVTSPMYTLHFNDLATGMYIITIWDRTSQQSMSKKLFLNQ